MLETKNANLINSKIEINKEISISNFLLSVLLPWQVHHQQVHYQEHL